MGERNIIIHSRQRQRYWCTVCETAFSARANTPYYRRRTDEETITRVVTLVDHGCPIPAVEAAFGLQAQTVREWMQASGRHCEALHHQTLLWSTPGCEVLNTAYIERLNATFQERLAFLARRTHRSARRLATVTEGMYLTGTLYNFCSPPASLPKVDGRRPTPAMAAGITDHVWTVSELLHYRVPPPRWVPPRRRGRRSKALQALIDRWCPDHRLA